MKKIKIIQTIGILLFLAYVVLFVLEVFFKYSIGLNVIVFSVLLAIISLNMVSKGVILRSSSTLWFAIVLILNAIFMILLSESYLMTVNIFYVFSIIPIIPSIILLAVFKNPIYIKVIILNIFIISSIVLWQEFNLGIWENVLNFGISILLSIVICRNLNFDREKV